MSERDALSLADLQAYGRIWGEGHERRALCPFCGDGHRPDKEHATLAFNTETGAWTCHRCGQSGLLREHWTELEPPTRRRTRPRPLPPPSAPSPAELAEQAEKRATLSRVWEAAVPIDAPEGAPGAGYLQGRAIPLEVAAAARVRFSADFYGRLAVLFPVQGERGGLIAVEGRYIDGGTSPKNRSAGPKSAGVFVAMPGALEADGVTICEGPITALSIAVAGYPALAVCGHSGLPLWLARRLALRTVLIAFDEGEQDAERGAERIVRELVTRGARPYRLRLPAEYGDWNDFLRARGRDAVDREMKAAMLVTLG
jgi:hypothetical protein